MSRVEESIKITASAELAANLLSASRAGVRISRPKQIKNRPDGRTLIWRRRGDSNSRSRSLRTNDLANRPLKPLGYPSVGHKSFALQNVPVKAYRGAGLTVFDLRFTQQPLGRQLE